MKMKNIPLSLRRGTGVRWLDVLNPKVIKRSETLKLTS
jgi:hypothetical protein